MRPNPPVNPDARAKAVLCEPLDGSNSYGKAEFYYAIPKVIVRVFAETERNTAETALRILLEAGVRSARLTGAQHTDHRTYVYVYVNANAGTR